MTSQNAAYAESSKGSPAASAEKVALSSAQSSATPRPTGPGQLVRSTETGRLGITTGSPAVRTPRIGVQFVGGPYPVLYFVEDLELQS